jgi:hypothetical protein
VRRFNFTRAILSAIVATVAGGVVWRLLEVGPMSARLLAIAAAVALLFTALWDVVPPRTRPLSKALVWGVLTWLVFRLPPIAAPAVAAWAFVLGVVYRPHPAPPTETTLRMDPPVRPPAPPSVRDA